MHSSDSQREALNVGWLLRVRWLTWATQALVVLLGVGWLELRLERGVLTALLCAALVSNLAATAWLPRRAGPAPKLAVMLVDVVLHTAVFWLTGGPFNPFTTLYLVNVALGTVVLPRTQQWVQLGASFAGFASLFLLERWTPAGWERPNHAQLMSVHLPGMLVAFVVASALVVASMDRLLDSLRRHEAALLRARELAAKHEKLAALTTLAAGAAHELATPLGTIAVASGELVARVERLPQPPVEVVEDARLISAQVRRCREILSRMSTRSGQLAGEPLTTFPLEELLSEVVATLQSAPTVAVKVDATLAWRGPRVALRQALSSLARNAQQAARSLVTISAREHDEQVTLEVSDDGGGLSPEVEQRLGEPFFTTRPPGEGMGLGVFLATTLARELGGSLHYESNPGRGTTAFFSIPKVSV